jgi:hypothetical protein
VNRRFTSGWRVATTACAVALVASAIHLQGQEAPREAPAAAAGSWVTPKTPWGHPDLQGIWSNATTTPLERLTAEEQKQLQKAMAPVRAATDGTGAGNLDTGRPLGDRTSLLVDPPDGRIPMTKAGIQRLVERENARAHRGEADSWLDRNSWERCISRAMPTAMIPNLYNNYYQVFQTPTHVAILIEMIHDVRIIPLDGRAHFPGSVRRWLGDSRGRWEGNTLVVETTNFVDRLDGGPLQPSHVIQTGYRGSGETLTLVERFTRTGPTTVDYRFTVTDPVTFSRPYTVAIPWRKDDTLAFIPEYACHEANHSMVNLLKAGRTNEQQAMEGAALVRRQRIEAGHPGVREPAKPIVPYPSEQ